MSIAAATHPWLGIEPYRVSVDQYRAFRRDGFLVVRGVVLPEHVRELAQHCDDLLADRVDVSEFVYIPPGPRPSTRDLLHRIHMGHQKIELWERYLLYPRVLDLVSALIGPDVAAMQTMLFTKAPGANGQGFHQDSYYIPTFPDTLIGAWIAIDKADVENGCLWMSPGSGNEPIYPPENGYGYGNTDLEGIPSVRNVGGYANDDDDPLNTLKPIAERYKAVEIPAEMEPGDVAFFGGHVLHRSLKNRSETRFRRSFVNHYCNARSFTTWGGGNKEQILARGNTHLEFGLPRFGTPCAATDPERCSVSDSGMVHTMMMATPDGMMTAQEPGKEDHDE
ncbi:phytanoyl-CoA dioxygenase family protein [Fimbriimonas ginsengisoli]|uniref:Phytanoyl-CoA dioxygenase n=1 Tax=Fimbriimonas ginsengisoli Gsoil 348 TaxID=661478 RepID=A0A068NLZ0_FIMGI|nr:phytanoyl-CoA dioxygenase family protein [Fimbriimonas ginsengisoli]AIE84491.1 Phytanoyl-CoA dioxygenase [Fimbriimonas ginsengisoli Gsoil 348]